MVRLDENDSGNDCNDQEPEDDMHANYKTG